MKLNKSLKEAKSKTNLTVLIVFIIFFCLVLFQHQFMWMYHDDYGYASLAMLIMF